MKRLILVLIIMIVLVPACGGQPAKSTQPPSEYVVTKSTYLYDDADIDAGTIQELPEGAIIKPSGSSLFCVELEELGTVYELCRVETLQGAKGWVLRKWIEPTS